jgi:hypothetical protein
LSKYNISAAEARVLGLTVILPLIGIWFIAAYGYVRLRKYAENIIESKDGKAMSRIADGIFVLALWLPIVTIISNLTSYYGRTHSNAQPAMVIVNNYLNLIFLLVAFLFIYSGTNQLPDIKKMLISRRLSRAWWFVAFIAVSGLFTYFTLANPARSEATPDVAVATYYLSDPLILLSIILPYIILLYFGFRSAAILRAYTVKVSGKFYRSALIYLTNGILISVLAIISIRILSSFTAWFNDRSLQVILGIIYLLLIGIALGFLLIARGAKRLHELEKI